MRFFNGHNAKCCFCGKTTHAPTPGAAANWADNHDCSRGSRPRRRFRRR